MDENDYKRDIVRRVFSLIEKDTISPEERAKMIEEYHMEEGKRTAYSEGMEKGREEGELRKAESIARKMLALGMDVPQITTITGLSREQIAELAA